VVIQLFEDAGFVNVDFNDLADVYVISTCTVTAVADKKSRQMINRAKSKNPNAIVVAVGCLSQSEGELLKQKCNVDIVVGNSADNGGGTNKGACWVLTLDTNGTVKTHYKIYDGVTNFNAPIDNYDYFGASVCGIEDIDSDNIPDIAVSAFYDNDGGISCGAVYIIKLKFKMVL